MKNKEISNRIVETVRIQYASGLYDIPKLIERWVPEVQPKDIESILDYSIKPDIRAELKPKVATIGGLYEKLRDALVKQSVLIRGSVETDEELEVQSFWDSIYTEVSMEYPWVTREVFRKIRAESL